jgi:hypothetical protein
MSDSSVKSLAEERLMPATHIVGLLFLLLMAGCVGAERTPPQTGAPQGEAVAVEPSRTRPTGQGAAKTDSPGATAPAKRPAEQPGKKLGATSSSGKPGAPPLDLTALETRLKETKAIGVFTKITLKNQVDDLLNQFRAYYQGQLKTTLTELRQPYDRLLLKVLSLLQDDDPELARAVVASREAIWSILADPAKFATL